MQAGPVLRGSSKAWKYPAVSGRGHRLGASFWPGRESFPLPFKAVRPASRNCPLMRTTQFQVVRTDVSR